MINRTFCIINKCINDSDKFGLPVEEGLINAYKQHVSMRNLLKGDEYNENETVLKEIDEYYAQRFDKEITKI